MENKPLITVVETKSYLTKAAKIFSEKERNDIVSLIARNPTCGVLMEGTGGVRKVRVGYGSRGKSGGGRVVYVLYNEQIPVFLLAVFAKNEKANLSKAERNELAKLVKGLLNSYRRAAK